jgi:hypothetical protein
MTALTPAQWRLLQAYYAHYLVEQANACATYVAPARFKQRCGQATAWRLCELGLLEYDEQYWHFYYITPEGVRFVEQDGVE